MEKKYEKILGVVKLLKAGRDKKSLPNKHINLIVEARSYLTFRDLNAFFQR